MSFEDLGVLGDADDGDGSAAVATFLGELRSLGNVAVPAPSPELAKLLTGGAGTVSLASRRRRRAGRGATILVTAGLVGTGWAAAANELPPAAQRFVADFADRFVSVDLPRPVPEPVDPPTSGVGEQGRGALDGDGGGGTGQPDESDDSGSGSGSSGDDAGGSNNGPSGRDDSGSSGGSGRGSDDDSSGSSGSGSDDSADRPGSGSDDSSGGGDTSGSGSSDDVPDDKVDDKPDNQVDSGGSDDG